MKPIRIKSSSGRYHAVIKKSKTFEEFKVAFYDWCKYIKHACYYTNDKQDAIDTANVELQRMD